MTITVTTGCNLSGSTQFIHVLGTEPHRLVHFGTIFQYSCSYHCGLCSRNLSRSHRVWSHVGAISACNTPACTHKGRILQYASSYAGLPGLCLAGRSRTKSPSDGGGRHTPGSDTSAVITNTLFPSMSILRWSPSIAPLGFLHPPRVSAHACISTLRPDYLRISCTEFPSSSLFVSSSLKSCCPTLMVPRLGRQISKNCVATLICPSADPSPNCLASAADSA